MSEPGRTLSCPNCQGDREDAPRPWCAAHDQHDVGTRRDGTRQDSVVTAAEALGRVQQRYSLRVGQILHSLYQGADIFYLEDERLVADLKRQYKFAFDDE